MTNLANTARAKFEALLPDSYGPPTEHEGWAESSLASGRVYENPPRFRGTRLRRAWAAVFGPGNESFRKEARSAQLGVCAVGAWSNDGQERPRLSITDTVYTPVNPVEGNTSPFRHTNVLYLIGAAVDVDGFERQQGVTFNFLQIGAKPDVHHWVGYHTQVAPGGSHEAAIGNIREVLNAAGFSTEHQALNRRIVDLADFCIERAQAI